MALDRRRLLGGMAATGLAALVGCSNDGDSGGDSGTGTDRPSDDPGRSTPPTGGSRTGAPEPRLDRVVATGMNVPWGIAFLPSGDALVSERDTARIVRVAPGGEKSEFRTIPDVDTRGPGSSGEGGLLGIALAPDGGELFCYLSTTSDNRVVRMRWSGGRLGHPRTVLTGIPREVHHNGGRIVFGPDDLLYVSTGDALESERAQDKKSLGGKVLRVTPGGRPAPDNPFGNEVLSYGHRNIEGLAFGPGDRLWATEFGDSETDELNLIRAGANYGWPEAEGRSDDEDFTNPEVTWSTDECSPAGIAIARDTAFLGALQGQCAFAVPLSGQKAGRPERFLGDGHGRIRTVVAAPDGALWVTTSNTDGRADPGPRDDQILRVTLP